jgi:hypothetical protein
MYNDQKRRKYKRIEKPNMARFRVKQHEGHEAVSTDWDMAAVRDLGAAGLFFYYKNYYKKDLRLGSLLDLKIDLFKSTPTINCVGKIIRIEEPIPPSIFGIATEFIEIDEQEKELIDKMAEGILD